MDVIIVNATNRKGNYVIINLPRQEEVSLKAGQKHKMAVEDLNRAEITEFVDPDCDEIMKITCVSGDFTDNPKRELRDVEVEVIPKLKIIESDKEKEEKS